MNDHSLRLMERAIDDIRRGHAVVVAHAGGRFLAVALEYTQETPAASEPSRDGRVIFSGTTARQLGYGEQAEGIALAVQAAIAAQGWIITPKQAAPETTLEVEIAARQLVRLAGLAPAVLVLPLAPGEQVDNAFEVSTAQISAYSALPPALEQVTPAAVKMPLRQAENTVIYAFRERQSASTHLALLIGDVTAQDAPLTRLHSSCITGDVLGSLRCECGDQLHAAIARIAKGGSGILLYLNQEGRSIGLTNKLRAYGLQDQGMDTVDANEMLGFAADERDFSIASRILYALKIAKIRLLTNNPAKVDALQANGITVTERLPLKAEPGAHNRDYLATKAGRMNHLL